MGVFCSIVFLVQSSALCCVAVHQHDPATVSVHRWVQQKLAGPYEVITLHYKYIEGHTRHACLVIAGPFPSVLASVGREVVQNKRTILSVVFAVLTLSLSLIVDVELLCSHLNTAHLMLCVTTVVRRPSANSFWWNVKLRLT